MEIMKMEEEYEYDDEETIMAEVLPLQGDESFIGICQAMTKPHLSGAAADMLEGFSINLGDSW